MAYFALFLGLLRKAVYQPFISKAKTVFKQVMEKGDYSEKDANLR